MKYRSWLLVLALALVPVGAYAAADYDILIPPGGITVDHTPVLLGQTVKIYATVDNAGAKDIEGTAIFMEDGQNFGMKAISAKATENPKRFGKTGSLQPLAIIQSKSG